MQHLQNTKLHSIKDFENKLRQCLQNIKLHSIKDFDFLYILQKNLSTL